MKPAIAVIGAGNWGKNLVRNFFELGSLSVIGDENPQLLEKFSREYPGTKCTTDIEAILADPSIHGVVIATPAETHGTLARKALRSGKDVFVEKPLCLDIGLGEELVRIAQEGKKILMVGHLLHYHPAVIRLKKMVKEDELGKIQYIYSNRLNFGMFRSQENVLWSFAPHDISVILALVGEMPESIQATGGNYLHQKIADVTITHFRFPGGVRGHVFVSWLNAFKEQKLVVMGDKQMAVLDDLNPWKTKLILYPHEIRWNANVPAATKAQGLPVPLPEEEPLKNECRHFIECIGTRSQPLTDGLEGLRVLKVLKDSQSSIDSIKTIASPSSDSFVHESAVLDEDCTIGVGTKIWHFSHILPHSRVGEKCIIGQNVVLGPNVTIGNHCKIQNNISIYDGVTLEDEVFCGPSMVFTNVNSPRAEINRRGEFQKTLVKRGATLGANSTIVCGHTIGSYAFIGAGAVVTHDVPAHALMVGNPARQKGWACSCGQRLPEDLTCPACLKKFKKGEFGLSPLEL